VRVRRRMDLVCRPVKGRRAVSIIKIVRVKW
jgi:hypothetical protein